MASLALVILMFAVSCLAHDYMTCSRNTDTFQLPSTLPSSPSGVAQAGKPGKQGPAGLAGPTGPKGEPGVPDISEITRLRGDIRILEQRLANTMTALYAGHVNLDDGWIGMFNGYQYKLTTSSQSWQESRRLCQVMGGDLATVGMRDYSTRWKIAETLGLTSGTWIGLSDIAIEGTFVWTDGVASTFDNTHWHRPVQPDNGGGNEDCGELFRQVRGYKTNDNQCPTAKKAMCEKRV